MEKSNKQLDAKTDCGEFCVPDINQVFGNVGSLLFWCWLWGESMLKENDLNWKKLIWKEGHLDWGNSLRKSTWAQGLFGTTCHRPGYRSWVGDQAKMMGLDRITEGFDCSQQWVGKKVFQLEVICPDLNLLKVTPAVTLRKANI